MEDILVIYYQPQTMSLIARFPNSTRLEGIIINPEAQSPVYSRFLDEIKDEEWKEWQFHSACSTGDPTRVMLIYKKK